MLVSGQLFNNRYMILRLVAEGVHANVYMAQDQQTPDRMVALKEYKDSSLRPETIARFEQAAIALEKFNHPHIARVYEHAVVNNVPYLVTEFVIGGTLEQQVTTRVSKVPEEQITQWGIQLCDALDYLHCQVPPIYLRTLKPDNVMIAADGTARLTDYGLSAIVSGSGSGTLMLATPGFSAPEEYGRAQVAIGPYTDVYSLGIMLLRLSTGYDPNVAALKIPRADKLNPSLSRNFASDIALATQADPSARYPNMQVFKQALMGATVARPAPALNWLYIGAGITVTVVVLALAVVALTLTGVLPAKPATPSDTPPPPTAVPTSLPQTTSVAAVVTAAVTPTAEVVTQTQFPYIYYFPIMVASPRMVSQTDALRLALPGGISMTLVRIPAGPFQLGSLDTDQEAVDAEKPQQADNLTMYLIGKYEVTNAQFAVFVKETGYTTTLEKGASDGRGDWQHPQGLTSTLVGKEREPVVLLTWADAQAFCRWASLVTGRRVVLPSEAMWEKAARGKDGRLYPWGSKPPDETRVSFDSKVQQPWPVGQYSPDSDSPYGGADMASNVQEWTGSLWQPYPYHADDGREDPLAEGNRVVRGGSFYSAARSLRAAWREGAAPDQATRYLGFRVAVLP